MVKVLSSLRFEVKLQSLRTAIRLIESVNFLYRSGFFEKIAWIMTTISPVLPSYPQADADLASNLRWWAVEMFHGCA